VKFCEDHWAKLRAAIDARGLFSFVAKGAEGAVARVESELKDGPTASNFEPLMGAHNAIVSNVISIAGLSVLSTNEDGTENCPVCYVVANCACGKGDGCEFHHWIERAADDVREEAVRLGLLPSA